MNYILKVFASMMLFLLVGCASNVSVEIEDKGNVKSSWSKDMMGYLVTYNLEAEDELDLIEKTEVIVSITFESLGLDPSNINEEDIEKIYEDINVTIEEENCLSSSRGYDDEKVYYIVEYAVSDIITYQELTDNLETLGFVCE